MLGGLVPALIKLVRLKEEAEDNTVTKIHDLLIPFEYTRVDRIIDIAFTAAKEVSDAIEKESAAISPEGDASDQHVTARETTPQVEIEKLRNKIINAIGKRETENLIRKSGALFWSVDDNRRLRVACTVSKRYTRGDSYWYAYHPKWDEFLGEGERGYFILGCTDKDEAYALPLEWIREQLPDLSQSVGPDDHYWHVNLNEENGAILFRVPKTKQWHDLKTFKLQL